MAAYELRQIGAFANHCTVWPEYDQLRRLPPENNDPVAQDCDIGKARQHWIADMAHAVTLRAQGHIGARSFRRLAHNAPCNVSAMVMSIASRPAGAVSISPVPGWSVMGMLTEQPSITFARLVLRSASRLIRS